MMHSFLITLTFTVARALAGTTPSLYYQNLNDYACITLIESPCVTSACWDDLKLTTLPRRIVWYVSSKLNHFWKWSHLISRDYGLRRISCDGRNYSQPYFFKRNQSSDNRSHGFGATFLLKKLSASDFSYERKSAFTLTFYGIESPIL